MSQRQRRKHLVFVPEVVWCWYEDHRVNPLAVPLERPHTGALLVAFPKLRDVKEPRLGRLVERGGEDEVTREKDPGEGWKEALRNK